ncbi:hypothetical protein XENOCAPTIV_003123 [Xenoophorus captivus]|uniref:Uncharacterized protein n=1 Tax=Xenoophorus captivus TaxID=1517983 RepID=A0ABV0QG50_9TELE
MQMFGQHVWMDILQLHTEPFQLHHSLLQAGRRRLCLLRLSPSLRLLLSDLSGQVNGSQPWFLTGVRDRRVLRRWALTPAEEPRCVQEPAADSPRFNRREKRVVAQSGYSCTAAHCGCR